MVAGRQDGWTDRRKGGKEGRRVGGKREGFEGHWGQLQMLWVEKVGTWVLELARDVTLMFLWVMPW